MSVRKAEDRLFESWKVVAPHLVPDGLVNESRYEQSRRKVLLILKDAYDNTSVGSTKLDLRQYIQDIAAGNTWYTAGRWMYGLQHLDDLPEWHEIERNTENLGLRLGWLQAIGSMNIKKSVSATATTDVKELSKHGANLKVRELLGQQWALYQPTYTLCGGYYPFTVMCAVLGAAEGDIRTTSNGVRYWRQGDNRYLLQACHPAARKSAKAKCYMVLEAVREIEGKG